MIPTSEIQLQIAKLLAEDTTTLAAVAVLHLHLAKSPFTPNPGLDIGTLTEADFDGYGPIDVVAGSQLFFTDPATGLVTVELKSPAGGWHFACTGVTNLPQTIYGFYVTDNADAVLYGAQLLDTPITISASGQAFDVPNPRYNFSNNSPM
jgi:hypothetical protein